MLSGQIIKKICPYCGKLFEPTKTNQVFCCRKCYMFSYRIKQRIVKYPKFNCPKCKKSIQLDFHPKMATLRWKDFECPNCGFKRNEN